MTRKQDHKEEKEIIKRAPKLIGRHFTEMPKSNVFDPIIDPKTDNVIDIIVISSMESQITHIDFRDLMPYENGYRVKPATIYT